jgi:hypothetical protein
MSTRDGAAKDTLTVGHLQGWMRVMTKRLFAFLLGLGAAALASAVAAESTPAAGLAPIRLPKALHVALERSHPGMRVLEKEDLKTEQCKDFRGAHPGWVSADFNGDGFLDYAVLLISAVPNKQVTFEGQNYAIRSALLAVFFGDAEGRYKEIPVYEFDDVLPTTRGIELQRSSKTQDHRGKDHPALLHPGLTFFSCGQFSVDYLWSKTRFDPVPTAN